MYKLLAKARIIITSAKTTVVTNVALCVTDIPQSMWHLMTNGVYMITCFAACMEVAIVSGFVVFLPKYLETQFGIGKSDANLLTGDVSQDNLVEN